MGEAARRTVKRGSAREDQLLAGLLAGFGAEEAAKQAGISRVTAYRIRQTEEFQTRLRNARSALLERTVTSLHSAGADAVRTLLTIANNKEARGSDRVQAAHRILDMLYKGVETFDHAERLLKLERIVQEDTK